MPWLEPITYPRFGILGANRLVELVSLVDSARARPELAKILQLTWMGDIRDASSG